MRALVVVESWFGNTAEIAEAIADGLREAGADVDVTTAASAPHEPSADLVVVAVPATAAAASEEQFLRSYSWVLNWSLSFGYQEWDCIAILPSVADPVLSPTERAAETTALEVIEGQDIGWLQRAPNDETPAGELLAKWLLSQVHRP